MTKTFGFAIAVGALALSACTNQPGSQAMGSAPAADLPQTAPAAPPRPVLAAMPAQGCVAPTSGTVTIHRGETAQRGSMQIYYTGRDETYRTAPYVYMFESNAALTNRSSTPRNESFFGLWRGQAQVAQACGRTVRLSLVRATSDSATITATVTAPR